MQKMLMRSLYWPLHRLEQAHGKSVGHEPAVHARLADLAQEIFPREQQTPQALGVFQKSEIAKWWPIIKAAGIKGE
jgi:hypothetical protein